VLYHIYLQHCSLRTDYESTMVIRRKYHELRIFGFTAANLLHLNFTKNALSQRTLIITVESTRRLLVTTNILTYFVHVLFSSAHNVILNSLTNNIFALNNRSQKSKSASRQNVHEFGGRKFSSRLRLCSQHIHAISPGRWLVPSQCSRLTQDIIGVLLSCWIDHVFFDWG
jgi:hypothetical protein